MSESSRDWDRLFVTGGGLLGRPPAENDLLGEKTGAFVLVDVIGRGGMSTVYLGERRDDAFEQRVAVKVLEATSSRTAADGFQRERQILARLDHPAIARIFDGGTLPDRRPWFAMEYVAGDPVDEHCKRQGADLDQRLRILEQIVEGLAAAHAAGVVHYDLKPENVLIDRHGHPKLLDFGIARMVSDDSTDLLSLMTPRFAAPEQFEGCPAGPATDIYQLGLMIYLVVTDRHAAGEAADTDILRDKSGRLPVVPASRADGPFRGRLDREFDRILARCLAADPEARYADADQLLRDLRGWRQGRSTSVGSRFNAPGRWWRHHRRALLASIISAVILIAAGWLGWERLERERARSDAMSELVSNVLTDAPGGADRITASSFELSDGAVADDPELERELTLLTGEALLRENREAEAAAMLENVLARSRGGFEDDSLVANAPLYSLLGEAYRRMGRPQDAGRYLDVAIEALAPNSQQRIRALERRAAVHLQQGDGAAADDDLARAQAALGPDQSQLADRLSRQRQLLQQYRSEGCQASMQTAAGTPAADAIVRRCEASADGAP